MSDSDSSDNELCVDSAVVEIEATNSGPDYDNRARKQIGVRKRKGSVASSSRAESNSIDECRLTPQKLRRACTVDHFRFATTKELPHVREIIGQPRGVRAIEFGIDINSPGYNIFMLGPPGTGRATAVRQFLERYAEKRGAPHDWVYVYNFDAPHKPRALMLPSGVGVKLRDAMAELVADLRRQIPLVLDAEEYRQAIEEIESDLGRRQEMFMAKVLAKASENQLAIMRASTGLVVVPAANGQPMSPDAFARLPEAQREIIEEQRLAMEHELEEASRAIHAAEKEARQAKTMLAAESVTALLDLLLAEIRQLCAGNHKAQHWLDELRGDILDNLESLATAQGHTGAKTGDLPVAPAQTQKTGPADSRFRRYQVNLVVNHAASQGAPVILEDLPTYKNLVGYIESEVHPGGAMLADFTMIKPGALHQASGGYLVVDAQDILRQPFAWEALKRALNSNVVRIEDPESRNSVGVLFPQMPAPEPIPISVKVVMLGTAELYYSLQSTDDEFSEMFKVKADFAATMERNHVNEHRYALFVAARCHEGHLPHFDKSGVAKIVEYGSGLAEDQGKLTTRFGFISDLVNEAAYWAGHEGKEIVSAGDVQRAIDERTYRANLVESEYRRSILEGVCKLRI